jgi:DnaJ-class molecular chaperone
VIELKAHVLKVQRLENRVEEPGHLDRCWLSVDEKRRLRVPTLEGSVAMRIPAGTQSGTVFRLKGKGMPELRRPGRGDELVTVSVRIPGPLSGRQKEAMEEFVRTLDE